METAAAMDFHTLSRRELQALCKRNGVRANMTNAAMAEALQGLTSVDGIDEIGTTLCLPTPGRSAMKSAAKVVAVEEQQHGSPLPRGRRVSVKSPEAIRMEVEGGEGEVKEIVKTPGVALRSTRRGTRATPAPLPTPVPACSTRAAARRTAARKTGEVVPTPATRRNQRTASRKATGAVEADLADEDVSEEKTSKMTMALDQEAEAVAAASEEEKVQQDEPKAAVSDVKCDDDPKEEKVQQEEPKDVTSDVKYDDPEEKEVANKEDELEEGEEADSSDATTGSAAVLVKSCTPPKVEEVVGVLEEQPTNQGIVEELKPISAEKSAPLTAMEDSPILGIIEKEQDASVEDYEDLAELSNATAREMTDEIIPVTEDMEVATNEEHDASVEDCADLAELSPAREMTDEIIPVTEDKEMTDEVMLTEDKEGAAGETTEEDQEDYLTELKEGSVTEDKEMTDEVMLTEDKEGAAGIQEDLEDYLTELKEGAVAEDKEVTDEVMLTDDKEGAAGETIEEDEEEGSVDEVLQAELTDNETSEEDGLTEVREGAAANMLHAALTDDETSEDDLDDNEEDEDDLTEVREGATAKMLQGELIDDGNSEEDDLDEDEEWTSDDDENTEEMGSTDESDEDTDDTNESHTAEAVQMLQGTRIAEEANEDASTEDDDFSGDLPPEFDNIMIFSDAETESDIAPPVLEENQAAVASATKTAKSLDDSVMNAEHEEGPEEADATEKAMKEVDDIVKSLDEVTFKEGESKDMQKQQMQDYESMSLRKLRSTYKNLVAAKQEAKNEEVTEAKRTPTPTTEQNKQASSQKNFVWMASAITGLNRGMLWL